MPIYAYRCATCGHAKDVLQRMSDPLLSVCPACGASTFDKQVTAAGFQLKGSGWYVTDFKGGAKPAAPATPDANAGAAVAGGDAAAQQAAKGDAAKSDAVPGDAKTNQAPAPAAKSGVAATAPVAAVSKAPPAAPSPGGK